MDEDTRAGGTILVVEDDEMTSLLLTHILERQHFEVRVLADGRQAASYVEKEKPALLVLLDMLLPYVGGFEIIRLIRGRPDWSQVPIIVVTSKDQEKDIARALDAGATDYIVKPFKPEELLARIRRRLRPSR